MNRQILGTIIIIVGIYSVICLGQEATPDSVAADSVSYFDAAYDTFIEYKPKLDIIPILIKILWTLLSVAAAVLLWRYLLRPVLLLILNSREYKNEVVIILQLFLIVFMSYFVIIKIFDLGDLLIYFIFAAVALSAAIGAFDFMRNLISGLSIMIRRMVKPGDKIKLENISGKVIDTGLQSTKVEHADGTILIIPNYQLSQSMLQKQAAADSIAPVDVNFYLPPDIDIVKVKEIAYRAVSLSRFVYLNKSIAVNLSHEFSAGYSFIKLRISAYVLNIDYVDQFKSDITENVLSEIIKKGILSVSAFSLSLPAKYN